eukprot:672893_1
MQTSSKNHEAIAVSLQQSSLFGDSQHQLKFGKALKKARGKDDLQEEDISDMLSARKAYERFGCCQCGGPCNCFLDALWKIRLLLINIICCVIGWIVSQYFITDEEIAHDLWFYTLYLFFIVLAMSITKLILVKIVMKLLVKMTNNTWEVFYVKNIRTRLYLSILSTLWVVGFSFFGTLIAHTDSHTHEDYHPTIYKLLKCICISSWAFLLSHILIRYGALHSYFEKFKVRARKSKTFIKMIELMAGKKEIFCLPIMNFLIDFPSAEDVKDCKKNHKSTVDFRVKQENEESAEEIADAMKHHIFDIKEEVHPDMDEQENAHPLTAKATTRRTRVMFATDADAPIQEDDEKDGSLAAWLDAQMLADTKHSNIKEALNALNILSVQDLEDILVDLYQTTHRHEFRETFVNKEWMSQLQKDMLNQGMSYSEWIKFGAKTYEYFIPKIKVLLDAEKEEQVESHNHNLKKATMHFEATMISDTDESNEIMNLNHSLYAVRLTGSASSEVDLISDNDLNKLTRMVSYQIMIRLNQEKKKLLEGWEKAKPKKKAKQSGDPRYSGRLQKINAKDQTRNLFGGKSLLELVDYKDNQRINKTLFIKILQNQSGNSGLLANMAKFAWKKFGPPSKQDYDHDNPHNDLDVMYLNGHIWNVFHDLLLLKKTVDSYTIIIANVQQMVDVATPLLLLFVYLSVFDFSFEDTLGLYISIVGVIAFFGQSYLESVFSSITFVMALNPFLVGDYIRYKDAVYRVTEISLISCTFKLHLTGELSTFRNEMLSKSNEPIINLSRSELTKTKYLWTVYLKNCVSNQDLDRYKKRVKELITHHKTTKNENVRSIKVRSFQMKNFTMIKAIIQMRYDRYKTDVDSVGFICCTKAMTELNLHARPLPTAIHLKND